MKTRHVKEMKQIRYEINKHLDNLEKQMIKDLEEKECQCKERIEKVLSSVKKKETMINQCQANFLSIKQHASDLQTFLGMREIELKVNKTEQYLQSSLIGEKVSIQLDLVCKIDKGVQNILNGLKHFGSTEIKTRPTKIEFSRAKDKQAQLQVTPLRKTVLCKVNSAEDDINKRKFS
ncbi:unnamed protein product [Mytilus coruscus]|uniref:Uncharacterized protein n=1 Tax=Mytilus coruscus TaxID=42192 RepID=A0A6J8CC87_MYTCO|nr:unnamed protein product [Mytilus coruscus]